MARYSGIPGHRQHNGVPMMKAAVIMPMVRRLAALSSRSPKCSSYPISEELLCLLSATAPCVAQGACFLCPNSSVTAPCVALGAYFWCSTSYMAQASISTDSRSHLLAQASFSTDSRSHLLAQASFSTDSRSHLLAQAGFSTDSRSHLLAQAGFSTASRSHLLDAVVRLCSDHGVYGKYQDPVSPGRYCLSPTRDA
jgi:hypothetical protein